MLGEQKCVSVCFLKYMLKSIFIIEILVNHTRYLKHLVMISGTYFGKSLHFKGLIFRRNIKSMESSSNTKFTHNVDYDNIKIINDGNFIYFVIAI